MCVRCACVCVCVRTSESGVIAHGVVREVDGVLKVEEVYKHCMCVCVCVCVCVCL